MESYEPISPPQSYQGIDKQETGGPPSQRREAESEIRCGSLTVHFHVQAVGPLGLYPSSEHVQNVFCTVCTNKHDQLSCF